MPPRPSLLSLRDTLLVVLAVILLLLWSQWGSYHSTPLDRPLELTQLVHLLAWWMLPMLAGCWLIESRVKRKVLAAIVLLVSVMMTTTILGAIVGSSINVIVCWQCAAAVASGMAFALLHRIGRLGHEAVHMPIRFPVTLIGMATIALFASQVSLMALNKLIRTDSRIGQARAIVFVRKNCPASARLLEDMDTRSGKLSGVRTAVVWADDPGMLAIWSALERNGHGPRSYPTLLASGGEKVAVGYFDCEQVLRDIGEAHRVPQE